jgi:hypothetical protein
MEKELEQKALSVVTQANELAIVDDENYQHASMILTKVIKPMAAEIKSTFRPIIEKAHASHKEACAQEKRHLEPLAKAEVIIKNKISVYLDEIDRKQREERARLEAEAKAQQEAQAVNDAIMAETKEEADAIIEEAINTTPVVIAPKIEAKAEGISRKSVWKWRLDNVEKMNRQFMVPNETQINTLVRAMGKNAETLVGGITVYEDFIISARA